MATMQLDILSEIIARAGGGGSSGGGGGVGIIVLPIIIAGAIFAWWQRKKQLKKARKAFEQAAANDPSWNTAVDRAKEIFYQFEQDWSNFNLSSMQTYLTPQYLQHIALMLAALKQMNRQNQMSGIRLNSAILYNVNNSAEDELDSFDVEIGAFATDTLIDLRTQSNLLINTEPFTELWRFEREGSEWKLDAIFQSDSDTFIEKGYTNKADGKLLLDEAAKMRQFAAQNSFFYNADFGWLLLPQKGVLFTLSSFGRSDINFHVIGNYHNILVQFYQYIPIVRDKRKVLDYLKAIYRPAYRIKEYTVAQAILPKSYGNIVVRRKGILGLAFTPMRMTRVSLEGVSFDKDFLVYATDIEKVTSLELLDPTYMEKLLEVDFEVNIEIVDNVLYLYSPDKKADFNVLLSLLQKAFEAMKM
jgi:hypothetical protein